MVFLRHVLLSKHRESEAVIPSTCRMICQFMLLLEQKLQTQKIQVIHTVYKLSNVPVFETMIQAVLSSLDFCLQGNCKHVELFVRLMISSSVRSVTLTWDQAFWKLRFGVLHGNILGFIISVDSNSVITEELCNVTALLNLHFLFFL